MQKNDQKQIQTKKPIRPTINSMEVFDKEVFPLASMNVVRVTTGQLKVTTNKVFKTRQVSENQTIEVIRIA